MFRSLFRKKLDFLSPEPSKAIEEAITVSARPNKKRWIIPVSAVLASALIVALVVTFTRRNGAHLAYRSLNAPKPPHNALHHRPSDAYLDSLRSFASRLGTLTEDKDKNGVFSPVSIASAFSMAYEAASGDSKKELAEMLGYDGTFEPAQEMEYVFRNANFDVQYPSGNGAKLSLADAFFVDEDYQNAINPAFIKTLTDSYYADAYQGKLNSDEMHDFLASWINEKTNRLFNLGKDDFKDLDGLLWLVNTVYCKANWDKLPPTSDDVFHAATGDVTTTFLTHTYEGGAYVSDDYLLSDVPLMYGLKYRVIVDNPEGENKHKTAQDYYEALLFPEAKIGERKGYDLKVRFPKYSAEGRFDLVDLFEKAGILKKSISLAEGDFSYAFPDLPFTTYISAATHQAKFDVNENGIEAAAYTNVNIGPGAAAPVQRLSIVCDRPFHFALIDEFETPLFLGSVNRV